MGITGWSASGTDTGIALSAEPGHFDGRCTTRVPSRFGAEAERRRKQQEQTEAEQLAAEVEADAATVDDWGGPNKRRCKARWMARMIVAAGGSADHVDAIELKDTEADPGVARAMADDSVGRRRSCWRAATTRPPPTRPRSDN